MLRVGKPGVLILPCGADHQRLFSKDALDRLRQHAQVLERREDTPFCAEELEAVVGDVVACVVGWGGSLGRLTDEVMDQAGQLRLIAAAALSPDGKERAVAMEARGILVVDCSWPVQQSVAEYVLGMIITSLRRVWEHHESLRAGGPWRDPACMPNGELAGSCIGVVGAGRVGRLVIQALESWPCRTVVADPYVARADAEALGAELVPLPALLATADVVTLHVQYDDTTRGLIGREELAQLRDGAILINAGRAATVDEDALLDELRNGRIRAVLDVFDPEPPPPDHPYFSLPNVLTTPHIAGHTPTMFRRCGTVAIDAVLQYLQGDGHCGGD